MNLVITREQEERGPLPRSPIGIAPGGSLRRARGVLPGTDGLRDLERSGGPGASGAGSMTTPRGAWSR